MGITQMTMPLMSRISPRKCGDFLVILSELTRLLTMPVFDSTLGPSHRLSLKVFSNSSGDMWKANVKDIQGEILCVSQFTLMANTSKGNKPDFHRAMVRISLFSLPFVHPREASRSITGHVRLLPTNHGHSILSREDQR